MHPSQRNSESDALHSSHSGNHSEQCTRGAGPHPRWRLWTQSHRPQRDTSAPPPQLFLLIGLLLPLAHCAALLARSSHRLDPSPAPVLGQRTAGGGGGGGGGNQSFRCNWSNGGGGGGRQGSKWQRRRQQQQQQQTGFHGAVRAVAAGDSEGCGWVLHAQHTITNHRL